MITNCLNNSLNDSLRTAKKLYNINKKNGTKAQLSAFKIQKAPCFKYNFLN